MSQKKNILTFSPFLLLVSDPGDVSLPSGLLMWQMRKLPLIMHRASLNAGLVGLISHCLLPHRREREERKEIREAANQFMAGDFLIVITFFF